MQLQRDSPPGEQHSASQQPGRYRMAFTQRLGQGEDTPDQRIRRAGHSAEHPDATHKHPIARQALRKAHEDLRHTTALVTLMQSFGRRALPPS